ncbi:MAG: exonuclease SbcCD subunit D [Treponema sp.]|jgi:exonuclease SbcD|nr:exonuclease SbcCD subunit D [Treponema sp.]
MLSFVHTADLHLGKVFHEHSLIEDQRYMLDGLREVLEDASHKALLIAGDVYDRSIPSPDAVRLFSSFLGSLKARRQDLEILILSGNHDSSSRLGFGKELFAELGIHLVTDPEDATTPIIIPGSAGEQGAFFLLPFLNPGTLKAELSAPMPQEPVEQKASSIEVKAGEAVPLRSQGKLAQEAAARLEAARLKMCKAGIDLTVLGAHLFALGSLEAGSERVFWGTAEQVDINWFSGFDYVALGHLHRFQKAGARAWYSGSPLAHAFEEASHSKVFLSVSLEPGKEPRINPLPVQPLRKLSILTGSFTSFFQETGFSSGSPYAQAAQDYLEIVLTDSSLVENPLALLRERFPWILSVKQEAALAHQMVLVHGQSPAVWEGAALRRTLIDAGDFKDFLMDIYGEADADKLALFQELLQAIEVEEQQA